MSMVKNINEMREGWLSFMKNRLGIHRFSSSFKEAIADRIEKCHSCPNLSVFSDSSRTIFNGRCEKCKCIFPVLVYSKSKKCPIGKWDSIPE